MPSCDNLNIRPLFLSEKYFLPPYTAKLSGFLLIPYLPAKEPTWPITTLELAVNGWPSAVKIASLSINALLTLFSWNIIKLVSSAYSFCILPFVISTAFVIDSPIENWFVLFNLVLALNIPEYIKALFLILEVYSSSTKWALTPKSTDLSLKPPLILAYSTCHLPGIFVS